MFSKVERIEWFVGCILRVNAVKMPGKYAFAMVVGKLGMGWFEMGLSFYFSSFLPFFFFKEKWAFLYFCAILIKGSK